MKFRADRILQEYGVVVALVVLFVANAIFRPDLFVSPEALRNLFNQSSYIGIVAVGMTLVIIAGGIDLSVGSMVALCGAGAVSILNATQPNEATGVMFAVAASMGLGILIGSFNGLLVSFGRLAPFIATLGGLVGFRSLAVTWAQGGEIRSNSTSLYQSMGNGGIPLPLTTAGGTPINLTWATITWVLVAVGAQVLLSKTKFGRHLVAVGANEKAAKYSGISVPTVQYFSYAILGLCCGIAGVLLSMRFNSVASSSSGQFYELDAIAAVVIGGTALAGGKGRIWGTVAGVLLLQIISTMMTSMSISSYLQGAVKGAIIILAVLLQREKSSGKA